MVEQIIEPELIMDRRMVNRKNKATSEVLVKWKFLPAEASWENYWDLIRGFPTFDLEARLLSGVSIDEAQQWQAEPAAAPTEQDREQRIEGSISISENYSTVEKAFVWAVDKTSIWIETTDLNVTVVTWIYEVGCGWKL